MTYLTNEQKTKIRRNMIVFSERYHIPGFWYARAAVLIHDTRYALTGDLNLITWSTTELAIYMYEWDRVCSILNPNRKKEDHYVFMRDIL